MAESRGQGIEGQEESVSPVREDGTHTQGSFGALLPELVVPPPGPNSLDLAGRLGRVESRNVTQLTRPFPVFWEAAAGANVRAGGPTPM